MKIKHLMYCPFTGLGLHNGFRGNKWLKNRIQVFKNFVVPSLRNQTNQNFTLWVGWRPEERTNPHVKELRQWLREHLESQTSIKVLFTYGGLCFWDDKYPDEVAHERLVSNLHRTMHELINEVGDADYVYMTIQPSDDCYKDDAVETIQNQQPIPRLMGWRKGYITDYATKTTAEYNPTTIPPFFTHVFDRATFIDPYKHAKYTGPYKSHEYVGDHLTYVELPGRGFCVGTHGENVSTVFNLPFRGEYVDKEVLNEFGIYNVEPVDLRKSSRLRLRTFANNLPQPLRNPFKKVCYKLKLI